jgi:predicted NUDIX family NTP pyrophosphohydrolase
MTKQSAGLLLFRKKDTQVEVLLGHPGGPFWAKKDAAAWSIPKGEFDEPEQPYAAAVREFAEEMGAPAPHGDPINLGFIKRKDGKTIYAWAIQADFDATNIKSNQFEMEWPPKSGKTQAFPEIDRADWFELGQATNKVHSGQVVFIQRLAEHLGINLPVPQEQISLL